LYRWAASGELGAAVVRLNNRWYVKIEPWERWLQGESEGAGAPGPGPARGR
jgi:hypothetical protein